MKVKYVRTCVVGVWKSPMARLQMIHAGALVSPALENVDQTDVDTLAVRYVRKLFAIHRTRRVRLSADTHPDFNWCAQT